jgi:uncharacterized protein YjiK
MNRIITILLVFSSFFVVYACGGKDKKKSKKEHTEKSAKKTELEEDYTVYKVPEELEEISGIAFTDDSNLVAIQDEDGILYHYNLSQEKITDKKKFAGHGDYEDLAIAGNDLYIITSNGDLYEIKDFRSGTSKAQKFKTPFTGKNNIEGLTYDAQKNRLLFAPKDKGLDNDKDKEIYAFDLKTKTLITTPVYSISLTQIEDYFKGDALEESSKKFLKAMGNQNLNEVFRPSAIAIHPITHEIYILSSINNLIAILKTDGTLNKIIKLKGKEFMQPEGLAFTSDGKLYVSNEGKGGKANVILLNL